MEILKAGQDKYNSGLMTYYARLLSEGILYEKLNDHEKRVTDLESELEDLRKLVHSDNRITNEDQFRAISQNTRFDTPVVRDAGIKRIEGRLEVMVAELKQVEDKRIQVQISGELVDEIRDMLKDAPKQKNNYRRQLLLMFHEVIKQNYAKALFNRNQIKALTGIARLCNEEFVTREQYFEMDDIFCECGLDMMPDWE